MISGQDIVGSSSEEIRRAFEAIQEAWPAYVFEYDSHEGVTHIYENEESFRSWEGEGWTYEYGPSLISMYRESFTCVMDRPETDSLRKKIEGILIEKTA